MSRSIALADPAGGRQPLSSHEGTPYSAAVNSAARQRRPGRRLPTFGNLAVQTSMAGSGPAIHERGSAAHRPTDTDGECQRGFALIRV
jgi:hypothetical protein